MATRGYVVEISNISFIRVYLQENISRFHLLRSESKTLLGLHISQDNTKTNWFSSAGFCLCLSPADIDPCPVFAIIPIHVPTWGPGPLVHFGLDRYSKIVALDDELLAREDYGRHLKDEEVREALGQRGMCVLFFCIFSNSWDVYFLW